MLVVVTAFLGDLVARGVDGNDRPRTVVVFVAEDELDVAKDVAAVEVGFRGGPGEVAVLEVDAVGEEGVVGASCADGADGVA